MQFRLSMTSAYRVSLVYKVLCNVERSFQKTHVCHLSVFLLRFRKELDVMLKAYINPFDDMRNSKKVMAIVKSFRIFIRQLKYTFYVRDSITSNAMLNQTIGIKPLY